MPRRRTPLLVYGVFLCWWTPGPTACNDEQSVGVRRISVVDNGSADSTGAVAAERGAIVVHEASARIRAEPLPREADMPFRAFDIGRFLSYIPHADIVNGTRIVEQLRARRMRMSRGIVFGWPRA